MALFTVLFLLFLFVGAVISWIGIAKKTETEQRFDAYGEWKAAFYGGDEERVRAFLDNPLTTRSGLGRIVGEAATEGAGEKIRELKEIFKKNLITKLAAVLVSGGLKNLKKIMSASEVGGTALVGISKPVIKAHGSSNAYAIQNAIRQARDFASSGMIESITQNIDLMRLDAPAKEGTEA